MNSKHIEGNVIDLCSDLATARRLLSGYLLNRTSDMREKLQQMLEVTLPEKANELLRIIESDLKNDDSREGAIRSAVEGYLISYHANLSLQGSKYVIDALVTLCEERPDNKRILLRDIHSVIMEKHGIENMCNCDRAFRYFIKTLFEKKSDRFLMDFGNSVPSVKEFLFFLKRKIERDRVI